MSLNVVHGPRGPHGKLHYAIYQKGKQTYKEPGAAGKVLFRPTPLTKKSKRFNIISTGFSGHFVDTLYANSNGSGL